MSNQSLIDAKLSGNGQVIIEEAERVGLALPIACGLVEQESGGRNIFGCDAGGPYCNEEVTQDRVAYLRDGGNYGHGMNGVGLTQLTWWEFVDKAEALGGAHLPRYQCRVGFQILKDLLDSYSYIEALAAYNAGEANRFSVVETYAAQLDDKIKQWAEPLAEDDGSNVSVKASDIVEAARSILGASYVWWELGDPLPKWYYQYPDGAPPSSWVFANGIHCSDFISYARQLCGLPAIGGTGDYQDWLEANGGVEFDPSTPGVPGALCVHRYEGPYGSAQGHISMFVHQEHLIQATSMYGVNEGEHQADSHAWANYYVYGLMPDVDYDGQPAEETNSGVGGTWREFGWYEFESPTSYKLIHHPGEGE